MKGEISEDGRYEVMGDGNTVWVNGHGGACLGRFGRGGIDIHNELRHMAAKGQCLDCTHGRPTLDEWKRFVEGMKKHHDVDVSEDYRPRWLGREHAALS